MSTHFLTAIGPKPDGIKRVDLNSSAVFQESGLILSGVTLLVISTGTQTRHTFLRLPDPLQQHPSITGNG